jgi:osmotically inducible lipoprotein OsmB
MKTITTIVCLGATLISLAACGEDPGQRALSGGGIGAGAGAVGAAVLGANPIAGALIGGGIGAATGGLTSPNTIDLDRR